MQKKVFLFILLLVFITLQPAHAKQKRVALVIGNSLYTSLEPLKNPSNDANDMAKQLKSNGFQVTKLINANKRKMDEAIIKFSRQLYDKSTVGLFYFAGHGVQTKNRSYLIPLASNIKTEADVAYNAVPLGHVLAQIDEAGNNFNLIIIDACRNNDLKGSKRFRSSGSRGLAKPQNLPKGSMIMYAAAPGQTAEDGTGRNGLFTSKLLEVLKIPKLTVDEVINKTAQKVHAVASAGQLPFKEGIVLNDFYFNDKVTINQPTIKVVSAAPDMAGKQENIFWNMVVTDKTKEMYQAYLTEYPRGHYARIAKIKLKRQSAKLKPKSIKPVITHAKLSIRSNVYNDTVSLNGEEKGSTPLDIKLEGGIYKVVISKKGYKTYKTEFILKSGDSQNINAKLEKSKLTVFNYKENFGERLALVIGNSKYSKLPSLKNPTNDAEGITEVLKKIGFKVTLILDTDKQKMVKTLEKFKKKIKKGVDIILFYYAGHAVRINSEEFMLPLDSEITSESDVKYEGINLNWVHNELNSSLKEKSNEQIFAYATMPGGIAEDGEGDNGLYTKHLLGEIGKPNTNILKVFRNVRNKVKKESSKYANQIPQTIDSISHDYFFLPKEKEDYKEPLIIMITDMVRYNPFQKTSR